MTTVAGPPAVPAGCVTAMLVSIGEPSAGTAVLVVSDELDDLRDCDRVLVMVQGRIAHEFEKGWGDKELVAAMEGL